MTRKRITLEELERCRELRTATPRGTNGRIKIDQEQILRRQRLRALQALEPVNFHHEAKLIGEVIVPTLRKADQLTYRCLLNQRLVGTCTPTNGELVLPCCTLVMGHNTLRIEREDLPGEGLEFILVRIPTSPWYGTFDPVTQEPLGEQNDLVRCPACGRYSLYRHWQGKNQRSCPFTELPATPCTNHGGKRLNREDPDFHRVWPKPSLGHKAKKRR